MDPIGLVQGGLGGDAFEKERDQGNPILSGAVRQHRLEGSRVLRSIVRRESHAGKDNLGAGRQQTLDDLTEIRLCFTQTQSAQSIVRAEFDDAEGEVALEV